MSVWYVLEEQTHTDLGWLHPVKRVRTFGVVELPGSIKKEATAYKWVTKVDVQHFTCKSLWQHYKKYKTGDDNGYIGSPWWDDQKCEAYHPESHTITKHVFKVRRGWRVSGVTQDMNRVRRFLG